MNKYRYINKKNEEKEEKIIIEISCIFFGLFLLFGVLTTLDYCGINIWNGNKIANLVFMIILWIPVGFIFLIILILLYAGIRFYILQKKQDKKLEKKDGE